MIPKLLLQLSSHPLPTLHYLCVLCYDDSEASALTKFLPQCTNLRTLYYERDWYVSESVEDEMWVAVSESAEEEMWEAAVRRCRNLEEVRVSGDDSDVLCDRLVSVLRELSDWEGIQALKLRRIVQKDCDGREQDYTEQVKHLLPALQP